MNTGGGSLDRYRIFYAVAQTGNLTRAAERLYLSQPAVSQAIKKLEAAIGGALFLRTARGVRLTAEGEVLFAYLQRAFRLIEEGELRIAELRHLEGGEVRVGASDTLCRHYLLPALEAFHVEYPRVQIHVTNRTSRETVALLEAGRIDFGVVNLPVSAGPLMVEEGPQVQDCFVVGSRYRMLAERRWPLAELARQPLLLLERGSVIRAQLEAFFLAHSVALTPEIELGSIDLLVDFARMGWGVAHVVRNFVQDEIAAGDLYPVATTPPLPLRPIGLVYSPDGPISLAADALMTRLRTVRPPS